MSCEDKRKHASADEARGAAERMVKDYDDPTIDYYRCPQCGWWHVGRKNKKRGERAMRSKELVALIERVAEERLKGGGEGNEGMSKIGKQIVSSLRRFIRDLEDGKPIRQTMVRRMNVKGKTVYARETFTAPIGHRGPAEKTP